MQPALARALRGSPTVPQEAAFTIPPLLRRDKQCTTAYSGYVTYPMIVCQPPVILGDVNLGIIDRGDGGGTSAAMLRKVQVSPVPAIGQVQVKPMFSFCRTLHGPWFASVVQQQSCNLSEPDSFTLNILGAPQPVKLEWQGTMQDAPSTVGALGNLSPTMPTCSCCGGKKQCPDGSCVPISSPCGQTTPAKRNGGES